MSATASSLPAVRLRPDWAGRELRISLIFLAFPAVLVVAAEVLTIQLPRALLWGSGGVFGVLVFLRSMRSPEVLLACFIVYVPLSRLLVAPLAPGINGTNVLELLLVFAWFLQSRRLGRPLVPPLLNSRLVMILFFVTLLSLVTPLRELDSETLMSFAVEKWKGWFEQLLVFFIVLGLVTNGNMARRVIVYMLLATALVTFLGAVEMIDRMDAHSIESSRVRGPQQQPNEFGAFIVTNALPLLAVGLVYFPRLRSMLAFGALAVVVQVLIASFSRGAYAGLALAGATMLWLRGIRLAVLIAVGGWLLIGAFPQLLPDAVVARFQQTGVAGSQDAELDRSAAERLIMWDAALDMTRESPILGKGFGMFSVLKNDYTDVHVGLGDTHNMFLYVSSQMGVPALLILLVILWRMFRCGAAVHRLHADPFGRAAGLACAGMVAAQLAINMFGSRMTELETSGFLWIYMAVLAHLWREVQASERAVGESGRSTEASRSPGKEK